MHRSRKALGAHLAAQHHSNPTALVDHAFVQCPLGCPGAFCILPKDSMNAGQSNLRNHLTGITTKAAHAHFRHSASHTDGKCTWIGLETQLRRDCATAAAPGTLGASLASITSPAAAPHTDSADPSLPALHPAPAPTTAPASPREVIDPDLDFPIPAIAANSDLCSVLTIRYDDVRAVSRRLHCQELPSSLRQQREILAPLLYADLAAGTDPARERAGCGLWLEMVGGAYIFHRRPEVALYR